MTTLPIRAPAATNLPEVSQLARMTPLFLLPFAHPLKTVKKVESLATELNVAEQQTAEAPGNGQPTEEEPAAKKKRAAAVAG